MTDRTWSSGPSGGTPLSAERLNGIEGDLDRRLQLWQPTTVYASGQRVVSPGGDVVSAKAAHTSPAQYDAAAWNLSSSYLKPGDKAVPNGVASLGADGKLPAGQLPAIAALSQAGTYAARPTAAAAGNAVTYYATDVQESYRSDGTTWTPVGAGGNNLGLATTATGSTTTSLTPVDIAGMAVTFTVGERPVEVRADVELAGPVGATVTVVIVLDGAVLSEINHSVANADKWETRSRTVPIRTALTPGSTHVVKLQLKTTAGTGRFDANATKLASLAVQGR